MFLVTIERLSLNPLQSEAVIPTRDGCQTVWRGLGLNPLQSEAVIPTQRKCRSLSGR